MTSINEFTQSRLDIIRGKTLFDPSKPRVANVKFVGPDMSRRKFLSGGASVIAVAALLMGADATFSPKAFAVNAVVYVDSAAAGANNGTSWANAYTTLAAAITASGTTGTDFYVKSTHTESSTSLTFTFKGVAATPDRVFSTTSANSPPQTADLTAGAAFTATSGSISLAGYCYIYGCTFSGSNSGSNDAFAASSSPSEIIMDTCSIVSGNGSTTYFSFGGAGGAASGRVTLLGSTLQFGAAGGFIRNMGGFFRWINGSVSSGGTLPTNLFNAQSSLRGGINIIDGVDLSALSSKTLVAALSVPQVFQFVNCKLPGTVTLAATPGQPGPTIDFIITDSTAVNSSSFIQTRYQYQGTLTADNTVYNGATDGVNSISWKVVSTANANPQSPFECFEIVQWAAAGTYASSVIQATSATGSLTNSDVWVHVEYLGTSGNPLAVRATSGNTNQVPQGSSPTALSTSGSWSTGGAGNNYVLAIPSFTTLLAGFVRFTVKIGKPSLTVYIDPKVTIA